MYDLTDYEFWKPSTAIKSSMTWRSALVLAACGSQFLEYRASKPEGKDPAKDFPGFDLNRIGRDLRECLGSEVRGIRSTGAWNEAAIQLTVLTRTRLVCFRPAPSTKDRPFFTAYEKGEELFTALGRSEILPFLLSPHSKPYWRSLLVLAVMSNGVRYSIAEPTPRTSKDRHPSLEGATSLSLSGIRSALDLIRKGFKAQARIGNSVWTKTFQADFVEIDGLIKLPAHLVFSESSLGGIGDMDVKKTDSIQPPMESSDPLSEIPSTFPVPMDPELRLLFLKEIQAVGADPHDYIAKVFVDATDRMKGWLRDHEYARFEAEKERIEAEYAKRLASLSENYRHLP